MSAGLAYCNAKGEIFFDERIAAFADGGTIREPTSQ